MSKRVLNPDVMIDFEREFLKFYRQVGNDLNIVDLTKRYNDFVANKLRGSLYVRDTRRLMEYMIDLLGDDSGKVLGIDDELRRYWCRIFQNCLDDLKFGAVFLGGFTGNCNLI